jgi:hypothetical protein
MDTVALSTKLRKTFPAQGQAAVSMRKTRIGDLSFLALVMADLQ